MYQFDVDSIVFCNKCIGIFYDQSSFIASKMPMYVINVNGTKTFIWKFINLVVPGGIWVKYSKLFYRVKAVDRNLLSAFRSFEMCNGAQTLIKSHLYFLFQIYSQRVQRKDFTILLEWLFRARKRIVKAIFFKRKTYIFQIQ